MRESLAQAAAAYAATVAAWAGWCAAGGVARPRLLDGALVVLECALVGHAVLGAAALLGARLTAQPGVYGGYLAASVLVLPLTVAGATDRRSRWDSLIVAIACVAAAVIALRMLVLSDG